MSIKERLTVTQFEMIRMCHQVDVDGNLTTIADVRLYNAAGRALGNDAQSVTWTAQEAAVILAKIAAKKTQYATATGWTEYVPAVEEEL